MSFAFSDFFNIFGRAYSFLKSKDDEMVVFLSLDTIADANKEIERRVVDNFTYLENTAEKWQEKVMYYTSQQAKRIFNADKAFKYSFDLPSEFYLKENGKEYKYIEKLFILRDGNRFIDYTCFYTDKAKKRFDKYWKPLEHTLRYKEYNSNF